MESDIIEQSDECMDSTNNRKTGWNGWENEMVSEKEMRMWCQRTNETKICAKCIFICTFTAAQICVLGKSESVNRTADRKNEYKTRSVTTDIHCLYSTAVHALYYTMDYLKVRKLICLMSLWA